MTIKYSPYHDQALINRANSKVGTSYPEGMCQAFTVSLFGVDPVGDYDGKNGADAIDGWEKAEDHGAVIYAADIKDRSKVPASTMNYYKGGSAGHGHAATNLNNGLICSTDLPTYGKVGKVSSQDPEEAWGLVYLGYVYVDGDGYTLCNPSTIPDKAVVQTTAGQIMAEKINKQRWTLERVHAYKGPGSTEVAKTVDKGYKIRCVEQVMVDGKWWAKGAGGDWWHRWETSPKVVKK